MYFIYALTDPRTDEIRYIGLTKKLEHRFNQHINRRGANGEKDDWIQQLQNDGFIPSIKVLEAIEDKSLAHKREAYWIQYYAEKEGHLTNVSHHKPRAIPRAYHIRTILRVHPDAPEFYCSAEEIAAELNIPRRASGVARTVGSDGWPLDM